MHLLLIFASLIFQTALALVGMTIGWFTAPFIGMDRHVLALTMACLTVLALFPFKPRAVRPSSSWTDMFLQLIKHNALRYIFVFSSLFMACYSGGWVRMSAAVVFLILCIFYFSMLIYFSETERIVSSWANGYFLSGSAAAVVGIYSHDAYLLGLALLFHALYWYCCCLGYCGNLDFYYKAEAPWDRIDD